MLYDLALCYERADWGRIDHLAGDLGIPTNLLTSLYFSCMEEVNHIWNELTQQMDQKEVKPADVSAGEQKAETAAPSET